MPKNHGSAGRNKKLAAGKQNAKKLVPNENVVVAEATTASSSAESSSKKFRHQNYNKNIYIGTKNAEKWEQTRLRLQLKNDVDFVTYLLRLADGEETNKFPERLVCLRVNLVCVFFFFKFLALPTALPYCIYIFIILLCVVGSSSVCYLCLLLLVWLLFIRVFAPRVSNAMHSDRLELLIAYSRYENISQN